MDVGAQAEAPVMGDGAVVAGTTSAGAAVMAAAADHPSGSAAGTIWRTSEYGRLSGLCIVPQCFALIDP